MVDQVQLLHVAYQRLSENARELKKYVHPAQVIEWEI